MRRQRPLLGIVLLWLTMLAAQGQGISPDGQRLAKLLDSMDVEHLWLAREYVQWRTGKTQNREVTDNKAHTHCSAFAAAVGLKLDIYLLRPPDHSATLLANAQYDWLAGDGAAQGWKPVKTMTAAQERANEGELVVAVYKESDPKKSGHIAIVRPEVKSRDAIAKEGPQIIQAGMENFNSTSLKEGFRHHKGAWKEHQILFYAHKIAWDKVKTDGGDGKDAPQ